MTMVPIWISYDPEATYPQVPRPGLGIVRANGSHRPPPGLASFPVETAALVHGDRNAEIEALYEVTAPDTLNPRDQAAVDAIKAAWQAEKARHDAREPNAESRLDGFLALPAIRGIKTLADADAFIDGQVTDLASAKTTMGRLLFVIVNLARYARVEADQIFPDDE